MSEYDNIYNTNNNIFNIKIKILIFFIIQLNIISIYLKIYIKIS
jgi:hypothetical protein